jgi:hypothetical protein
MIRSRELTAQHIAGLKREPQRLTHHQTSAYAAAIRPKDLPRVELGELVDDGDDELVAGDALPVAVFAAELCLREEA